MSLPPTPAATPTRRRRLSPLLVALAVLCALVLTVVLRRAVSPWTAVSWTGPTGRTAGPGPSGQAPGPTTLRVAAFNIAHGRGATFENFNGEDAATRAQRLSDIGAFLKAHDLEVVVLNEVDFSSVWSGHVDQASAIAAAAGLPFVARQKNLDVGLGPWGLAFGNAVLSRHPIVDVKRLALPARSIFEAVAAGRKQSAVVTLDVGGKRVRIIPVHLEHRDETTRLASARLILDVLAANMGAENMGAAGAAAPAIVVGDFNSTRPGWPLGERAEGTTALQALLDGGLTTATALDAAAAPRSFPSWDPYQRIDWVLVQAPLTVTGDDVGGGKLSDHLAVWSTVGLP